MASASTPTRVLVTGVSSAIGGMVAAAFEQDERIEEVVGVDTAPPRRPLTRTEFVRADLRNPLVARVIDAGRLDTVVHLSTHTGPGSSGGRSRMKELNVLGAMQLFSACQRATTVRRVVVKSSTAVYGSSPGDPAAFGEDEVPDALPRDGWSRDAVEVERYAEGLAARRPDIGVVTLRFANFLGAEVDSVFARFFSLPVVPSVLGFDPRLQFIHERDAVDAIVRAAHAGVTGPINVAAPGVLYLSQAVRLAGRVPVPIPGPLAGVVAGTVRRTGAVDVTAEQLRLLRFGRVADCTRLHTELGLVPARDARSTFEDFVNRRRISGVLDRDEIGRWEQELYDFISRRGQERFVTTRRGGRT